MTARPRAPIEDLGDRFWPRPALVVAGCIGLAVLATAHDHLPAQDWKGASGSSGGGPGARRLMSSVASWAIGIAGTIVSLVIAALSLASGQTGPRPIRTFVVDARRQLAPGMVLGTFASAPAVPRTVRMQDEGAVVLQGRPVAILSAPVADARAALDRAPSGAMVPTLRQDASGSPDVLIRCLEVPASMADPVAAPASPVGPRPTRG